MTHEAVRRAKLAEMVALTFARAGRELCDALESVGSRLTGDDVERILGDAVDELLANVTDRGFLEEDTVDPDAALDAARDAAAGVL